MFQHITVSRGGQPVIYDAVADGVGHCQAELRDAPCGYLSITVSAGARSQSAAVKQTRTSTPAQELQTGAECFCFGPRIATLHGNVYSSASGS